MDDIWYYEDYGKAQGPLSTEELVSKIVKGDLRRMDLLFKDGSESWLPLEEFPELIEFLGQVAPDAKSEWVALKSVEVDGKEKFEQVGPFATEQVLSLIDQGRLRFSDYIWKPGFENWVTLGAVDELARPLPSSVEVDKSLYSIPNHKMLEDTPVAPIREFNPMDCIPEPEQAPQGAVGPDLAKPSWAVEKMPSTQSVNILEDSPPIEDDSLVTIEETQEISLDSEMPIPSRTWAALKLGHATLNKSMSHFKSIRVNQVSAGLKSKFKSVSSYGVVAIIFLLGAFVLRTIVSQPGVDSSVPVVKVVTDSPVKKPVTAKSNRVVASKTLAKASEKAPAKVSAAKETVVGKPPKVKVVKGTSSLNFSRMSSKRRAYYHHRDRKMIFYVSQRAIAMAGDLKSSYRKHRKNKRAWRRFYSSWKKRLHKLVPLDLRDNRVNGSYVYPKLMVQMGTAFSHLKKKGKEYDTQIKSSRNPTKSVAVKGVVSKFNKLKSRARRL